jgi:hypothetical protein
MADEDEDLAESKEDTSKINGVVGSVNAKQK